jgi:hypothetical protein
MSRIPCPLMTERAAVTLRAARTARAGRSRVLPMLAVLTGLALAGAAPTAAQTPGAGQFQSTGTYAGPRAWVGNLNGAVAIGGQVERGLTEPGRYGPGIIAGGVGVDYYTWSSDFGVGSYSYSVLPIQLFGNYHFVLEANPRIDPYLGMAFVYQVISSEWSGAGAGSASASTSGSVFAGQAGARYFLSDKLALQGQVGFGYGTLGLGATWRF